MTKQEWLVSTDIWAMLWCAKFGDRKNRLFSCACCRHIWHLITDPRSRKAVEVAELYADGLASGEELSIARNDAWKVYCAAGIRANASTLTVKPTAAKARLCRIAAAAAADATHDAAVAVDATHAATVTADTAAEAAACAAATAAEVSHATERPWQINLLKHLTNPFETLTFKHNNTTIDNLALALYNQESCHYALHDLLLEEGCLFAEHFKEEFHPKGCLYLDHLLGK